MTTQNESVTPAGTLDAGTPAGWFPDPEGTGDRWWNGLSWSQQRQPYPQQGDRPQPDADADVPVLVGLDPEVIHPAGDPWNAVLICDLPGVDPASTVEIALTAPVVSALYESLAALSDAQLSALGIKGGAESVPDEGDDDSDTAPDLDKSRTWSSIGDPIGAVPALRRFSPWLLAALLAVATVIALIIR